MNALSLSLRSKTLLVSGACLLSVVAGLVGYAVSNSHSLTEHSYELISQAMREAALAHMGEIGASQGKSISLQLAEAQAYLATYAQQLLSLKAEQQQGATSAQTKRNYLYRTLQEQVAAHPETLGTALAFDPGQLDGADASFAGSGQPFGNDTGRFAAYVSPAESFTIPEKDLLDTQASSNAWFVCPHQSRKTCLINPYSYRLNGVDTLMTTVSYPLIEHDRVLGVVSADLTLSSLQKSADEAANTLYDGLAVLSFISPDGVVAARSRAPGALGKSMAKVDATFAPIVSEGLASGKPSSVERDGITAVFVPFTPLTGAMPWGVLIEAPSPVILKSALQLRDELTAKGQEAVVRQLLLGTGAVIFGLLLMMLLANSIARPILSVAKRLEDIASGDGDLTRRLNYQRKDELGILTSWFDRFLDKLQPVIADVRAAVDTTRAQAKQAAGIAVTSRDSMQRQFQEVDQVATAAQEMSATAHDVARNTAQAADASRSADEAASACRRVIDTAAGSIRSLSEEINHGKGQVETLAANSEQIGQVLEVIRSVAEQTNLLALNAAIEAARAGESGRGFAVVADEVRQLASRTQDSVLQIQRVIEAQQHATSQVVRAMQISFQKAKISVSGIEEASNSLRHVNNGIEIINEMNLQVASAAEEQSAVCEEVSRNVASIRNMTESLTARAQESAVVSEALNDLADQQQRMMSGFKA
nr:methyl-accepting chemotaxis protein [Pseudomonas sp. C11]